ncbi:MAG: Methyltransferase type 11 [Alphaproteobacteria bacterium]|nr:Methyltransferase type 11 [Alphaproteobacteria bacterium]
MSGNLDVQLWAHYQTENAGAFVPGHPRQDVLAEKVIALSRGGKLLEIGFGDGYLLAKLASIFECYGCDISAENVRQMQERFPTVKFEVSRTDGRLPFADGFFDLFVASEVLEHLPNDELKIMTEEIRRVLKPGGRAIVTFPARERLADLDCFCPNCGHTFHRWGHKQSWDDQKIERIFSKFADLRVEEHNFPPANLNAFGKIEAYLRRTLAKFVPMSGMTYVVVLSK